MADPRDCPVLRAEPVTTVPEVIERLAAVRDSIGEVAPKCGIAYFSDLYLTITQSIWEHIGQQTFFNDDGYVGRWDVLFANRYFDALRVWATGGEVWKAWQVLFDCPADGTIAAARLAGVGVNAHINLDLAVATVEVGREMGDPELGKGVSLVGYLPVNRREDYDKINEIFELNMDALLDRLMGETDEDPTRLSFLGWMMSGVVRLARRYAWEDAEDLWPLPRPSEEWDAKERDMDHDASKVGLRLLVDLPDWLDRGL